MIPLAGSKGRVIPAGHWCFNNMYIKNRRNFWKDRDFCKFTHHCDDNNVNTVKALLFCLYFMPAALKRNLKSMHKKDLPILYLILHTHTHARTYAHTYTLHHQLFIGKRVTLTPETFWQTKTASVFCCCCLGLSNCVQKWAQSLCGSGVVLNEAHLHRRGCHSRQQILVPLGAAPPPVNSVPCFVRPWRGSDSATLRNTALAAHWAPLWLVCSRGLGQTLVRHENSVLTPEMRIFCYSSTDPESAGGVEGVCLVWSIFPGQTKDLVPIADVEGLHSDDMVEVGGAGFCSVVERAVSNCTVHCNPGADWFLFWRLVHLCPKSGDGLSVQMCKAMSRRY